MKGITSLIICAALGSSSAFANDCIAPDTLPAIPDGKKASMKEMIAGQGAVKAFQAANVEYMGCMDPLIDAATEATKSDGATEADMENLKAMEKAYNAAISREEELANSFNTAIREYKEANPD